MRDIAAELADWSRTGRRFAMASVVAVAGSAPRPVGTALAVAADGAAVGGVSGGCVEGAVYELCQQVLADGHARIESFGYSDDDAFAVGLTCGGTVTVFVTRVEPGDAAIATTAEAILANAPVALARVVSGPDTGRALAVRPGSAVTGDAGSDGTATVTGEAALGDAHTTEGGPDTTATDGGRVHGTAIAADGSAANARPAPATVGSLGDAAADQTATEQARDLLARGHFGRFTLGERDILVETYPAPPRLLVYGAADFAAAVVRAGKFLGYRVTVCDARAVFATARRFPEADEVVVDWPHRHLETAAIDERTAICVLTHDAKFDIPLLKLALRLPVGYVGAMGSRRTHRDRLRRLRDEAVPETALARLHSPIGLDLGGRSPEETALSIAAEIVALRNGAPGGFLSATDAPIHRDRGEVAAA